MSARRPSRLELPNKKNQRNSHQDKPSKRSKAIVEREKRSLPLKEAKSLCLSVYSRIRMRETVRGEIIGEFGEELPVVLVK
jgi:hypothetical protein